MIKDIQAEQKRIEDREFKDQRKIEKEALKLNKNDPEQAREYLTNYQIANAESVLGGWLSKSMER